MPIQEYTYDSDDEGSRERAISDAANVGSLATFVHGKDTSLNLIEAGNKTGSADVYERLCERCNNEISKLFLGNTLTTESSDTALRHLAPCIRKERTKSPSPTGCMSSMCSTMRLPTYSPAWASTPQVASSVSRRKRP